MIVRNTLGALGAVVLALGLMVAPGAAEQPARRAATLTMTINGGYDAYVGGQGVTLTGRLPKAGVRKIWLERHMNRPGDVWTKVEDLPYRGTTLADGSFTMQIRASSMVGLSYRVRGAQGGGVTPRVTFSPKTQDVEMYPVGDLQDLDLVDPRVGLPFFVVADTTPALFKRPDTQGLPVYRGRQLTLQRQISPTQWENVPGGTTVVGPSGLGLFPVPIVETSAGDHVYRVRMEDWKQNGSDVGWQASFPTYVRVRGILETRSSAVLSSFRAAAPVAEREVTVTGTAAQKYQWYPVVWGFSWQEGEDLDSPPMSGAKKGRWVQYTEGAGRVGKHNGGLRLDSGRLVPSGRGDSGTTRATLTGNAFAHGRWEARLRMKTFETMSPEMDIVLELVPEKASDYQCGRRNITIARYAGDGSQMTFGVNAGNTRWTRTIEAPSLSGNIPALAVEVAKDHIAWTVDGRPVGVVKGKAAVSDVPMTMRFSLEGDQDTEYRNTSTYSDWQRYFGIGTGKQVERGPRLAKSALNGCVD
jgi:hypothetical protein